MENRRPGRARSVARLLVGLEYLCGRNERQDGQEGWADRLQFSVKYDLTR